MIPSDESLLFARAVEALRAGVEALGPEWACFPAVWNPSERYAEKTAEIRVRRGDRGTSRSFAIDGCRLAALGDLLQDIAAAGGASAEAERAIARLTARWHEMPPERMRAILAAPLPT